MIIVILSLLKYIKKYFGVVIKLYKWKRVYICLCVMNFKKLDYKIGMLFNVLK